MLSLVLLAVAAANAAPMAEEKLPFLPEVFKNGSSFYNEAAAAAALDRFHSVVGSPDSLVQHRDLLRSLTASQSAPEIEPVNKDLLAAIAARMEGTVIAAPSVVDINKPIAQYLYGGDVMLSPEDLKRMGGELPFADNIRNKRGAPVVTSNRWPKTQPISFIFNSDVAESTRQLIRTVTQKIAANTCLSFQENSSVGTQLQFHRGGGCWSYIGDMGWSKQLISIDSGCENPGVISHELSHALGIDHTQNRFDRDAYVSVNIGAVASNNQNNFAKRTSTENNNFGVPYEYGSDMHYAAFDFSINGQAVLVASQGDYTNTMGQRKTLTFTDFKLINSLYNCSASCSKQMVCQNGGYPSPKDCNACVCSDFYTGANCQTPKTTISLTTSSKTTYHQDFNSALYSSGNNYNWEMFGKDAVKIIRAPEGKKIKVTINQIYAAYGQLSCFQGCPFVGLEFVDNANGDLTTMGKIFCCTKDENTSFTSKSNVIGYKAFASPGMPFDAAVTYTVV